MRIFVDADACPVKETIVKIGRKNGIPVTMIIDTSHVLQDDYSQVVTVDKGSDSVDFAIVNRLTAGDIVVTQDYGLASMVLAKKCHAVNQNGFLYTSENIDRLLFERHMNKKIRQAGGKTFNAKKRNQEANIKFEHCFQQLVQSCLKGQDA